MPQVVESPGRWSEAEGRAVANGCLPVPWGEGIWLVRARSHPGEVHQVTAIGPMPRQVTCSCPGARDGWVCYHMAAVALRRADPEGERGRVAADERERALIVADLDALEAGAIDELDHIAATVAGAA